MQAVLKVVDGKALVAIKDNEVVPIALMVAEKEVLAVSRAVGTPMFACDLDRGCLGVLVPIIDKASLVEKSQYFFYFFTL